MANYYVCKILDYYARQVHQHGGVRVISETVGEDSFVPCGGGCTPVPFTLAEAKAKVEELDSQAYCMANGEAGRPEYIIVGESEIAWLSHDDPGKYDWDGYEGTEGDDMAEAAYMLSCDERYAREHAVSAEEEGGAE